MDIALNITTAPQPIRSKEIKSLPTKPVKKKSIAGGGNGFSFEFGGSGQKVKAVVARKRPVVKANSVPAAKPEENDLKSNPFKAKPSNGIDGPLKKSVAIKRKANPFQKKTNLSNGIDVTSEKSIKHKGNPFQRTQRKNFVMAPPDHDTENVDLNSFAEVKKPAIGDDLMLNICTVPAPVVAKQTKAKLTRTERLNQKRNPFKSAEARTLTKQEIKSGLRRHAENPNKLPRVGDLFAQREAANRAANEEATESVPEVPRPPIKRPTREVVKKMNLFEDQTEAQPLGQRLVKPITERIFDGTKIDSLNLHPHAVKNLADLLSITELTTVQKKTIPQALEGKDLLVRSQTGSGKTLAYALPVVEKLQELRPKLTREAGIMAVVIVPSRELAIQTYELFQKLLKPFTWIVAGVLMGGERRKAEKARLRKGINILVGTPGRLVDHLLHTESFKLNKAKFLVLDEADRLLELGYERDVKQIVEAIDKQRAQLAEETKTEATHLQRMLLSATLTSAVHQLAGLTLHEPIFIDNSETNAPKALRNTDGYSKEGIEALAAELEETEGGILTIPESLQLSFVVVPPKLRLVTLSGLLAKEHKGKAKLKVVVFMSTTEMVGYHHDLLNEALTRKVLDEDDEEEDGEDDKNDGEEPLLKGLRFFKLYGSLTQTERQGVFKSFRECKSGVLLATDVVGRGIDVPELDLVVQYSPPQKVADFVHRVGRTARAGRSGRAVLFLAPGEVRFVRILEDKRIRISQISMDSYLQALVDADDEASNIQEASSNLQHKFQELVADDTELHEKACKAFVSWVKFLSTFPKDLKPIFSIKNAHMGHFAKSFGLKDEPSSFAKKHSQPKPPPPTNRLTYTERDPEKIKQEKRAKKRRFATTVKDEVRNTNRPNMRTASNLLKLLPKSRALNTSEFDSGLPAPKKRK